MKETKEKEEKKEEQEEEQETRFTENFPEIKDASPLFKPSNLEQFVSQAEPMKEEKEGKKEKRNIISYSGADYSALKEEKKKQRFDSDIDASDLRRRGMLLDISQIVKFKPDFSFSTQRMQVAPITELKGSDEIIIKYTDRSREVWKEELGSFQRREIRKYRRQT